jgi:hypothetical protein
VIDAGGITSDTLYPYESRASNCDNAKNNFTVSVTNWYRVFDEQAMIDHVLEGGTLTAVIDSTRMRAYKSGVYSSCTAPHRLDHTVNIVGVNVTGGYWKLRNSWGIGWGEEGYMKIALVGTSKQRIHPLMMMIFFFLN